ncbi:TetR/AcrR family transcriptional regulator [Periweissella cryptocerci]|uniref:TetR/AcrR family transcriptional regulator n=1 Tax=Periweissella cryptocerci TaxID=2506420 RepID=A0A4P6YVV5_9LACO|nr:TetR/AcrR family transcriptional regulator [Periweissella cryptocerci]QBO36896.1 TetR/AcrR family transcriptional regulator [Periweissella cryptocerci]
MTTKTDPRVLKTRNSLKRALVKLMREYKLQYITVQKITEEANITRGTFYLHYHDKEDFVQRAMQEIIDDFFAETIYMTNRGFKSHTKDDSAAELCRFSIARAFAYIENDSEVFDVLLNEQENNVFEQQIYNHLSEYMQQFKQTCQSEFVELEVPDELQISFIVSALLGVIKRWLHTGMMYTPRYMTASMKRILEFKQPKQVEFADFFDAAEVLD